MKTLILTFLITALTLILVGQLITFCRKKLSKTPHGLSGMCHRQGSEVCASCAETAEKEPRSTTKKVENIKDISDKKP